MSATTEDLFILDSDDSLVGDNPEVEKKAKGSFESAARKRLGDISNLPQRPKPSTKDEKEQFVSNTTKEYIEHLKKKNMMLMKLLADRNKIIEFSGIELQKLRINFQKMRQQNLQLAQSNSQMLTDLNSEKDRSFNLFQLKVLQHELGSKNALLNAKKLELKEKAEITCQYTDKQGTSKSEEARESLEADRADNEDFKTKKRQQSKSLDLSTVKQVQLKEKTENKSRASLRRQSARFKSAEPEPTEEVFEIDNAKFPVCSLLDDQMREDGSTSTCSSAKTDDKRGSSGPSDDEARDRASTEQIQLKEKTEKKRACLRRQSARSKHQESEPTEDTFEIVDTKFPVCSLHDDQMQEDGSTSMCSLAKDDKRGISDPSDDKTQQLQRSSIGRPLRLVAKKVQSYKEIPVNVKMRRKE
ncbi:SHUGOSHIN 2-like isoform X3 [Camellia sinensis]|uniref:SHUGOSHIN 2-like isoform X3 n=1 Tax=Camellia sinensis TaxID=4442 RepID=UPI00103664D6|nr:SHUGOSHIN 2-like isoform X3 [Camellia sinensis]